MKRNLLTLFTILVLALTACNDGYEEPRKVNPQELNSRIASGFQQGDRWVQTPQGIVKELLPKSAYKEANYSYKIDEKRLSDNLSTLVIVEEGIIDNEISGERMTLNFRFSEGKWIIEEMTQSLRRRN